jgi:hypothetical protein
MLSAIHKPQVSDTWSFFIPDELFVIFLYLLHNFLSVLQLGRGGALLSCELLKSPQRHQIEQRLRRQGKVNHPPDALAKARVPALVCVVN